MRILWGKYAYPVDMVELDILLEKSVLIPIYLSLEFFGYDVGDFTSFD
jgi:hypothetical protein